MSPDEWFGEGGPSDPESIERERRRLEREARRRGRDPEPTPPQPAPPDTAQPGSGHEIGGPNEPATSEPSGSGRPSRPIEPEPGGRGSGTPAAGVDDDLAGRLARRRSRSAGRSGGGRPPRSSRHRSPGRGDRNRSGRGLRSPKRTPLLVAAVVIGLVGVWFLTSLFQPFHGGSGSEAVKVKIPKGASVGDVGDILGDNGVIDSSLFFQMRATLDGKRSNLYPGTYTLNKEMSYSAALSALTIPPLKKTITLTIPEGYDRSQIAQLAEESGLPGDYTTDSVKYKGFDTARYGAKNPESLEGFLFPATYELPPKSTSETLVGQQLDAFNQRIAGVNMKYAKSKNLTVYDILIIASMIEGEVRVPKERKLVAAVIYNRLKQGIPLGIDATIRFATGNHTEALKQSELEIDSPYNTRINAGLPPGPIGNPGIAAIEAAAHPAQVNYLYYVVKPGTCGEHAFSSTDAQFQRDVDAYNKAREAAGGQSPDGC